MQAEEIVSRAGDLPLFPQTAMKALRLSENPNSSPKELQAVISVDQALTARILKIVNSAMFSFPREISTLSHAVAILGMQKVRSIIMAASVQNMFESNGSRPPGLASQLLWKHSLGSALAAKALALRIRYHNEEEAFTGGLLHDIGQMILLKNHERDYQDIIQSVVRNKSEFHQAEVDKFGFAHPQVGSLLAARWHFPNQLVDAILYHHDPPSASKYPKLAAVVSLGNLTMRVLEVGFVKDAALKLEESPAALFLRLDAGVLRQVAAEVQPMLAAPAAAGIR